MVNMRMFALLVGASGTLSEKLPEYCRACAAVVVQLCAGPVPPPTTADSTRTDLRRAVRECVRVSHGRTCWHRAPSFASSSCLC